MGKELTPEEMFSIVNEGILTTTDKWKIVSLRMLSNLISDEFITPNEHSHTFALADNPSARLRSKENTFQTFQVLTGINPRDCDLPTK